MPLHCELAGHVIQLFADVFTNTLELAAALALGIVRFVVDQVAGQFRWQLCAFGLVLWPSGFLFLGHCLIQLDLDSSKVTVDQFVQQFSLDCIQLLTAAGELVAL